MEFGECWKDNGLTPYNSDLLFAPNFLNLTRLPYANHATLPINNYFWQPYNLLQICINFSGTIKYPHNEILPFVACLFGFNCNKQSA